MRALTSSSLWLALIAAALLVPGHASADISPHPCQAFTPCSTVLGPWVTAPSDQDEVFTVSCPSGQFAVSSDAGFRGPIYPVGVLTGGSSGYDGFNLSFGAFPIPVNVTFQPAVGCAPQGAALTPNLKTVGNTSRYRTVVRSVPVRPRAVSRVRVGCRAGERLVHSGSAVEFFTRRPPSPAVIKSLVHHHRRVGAAAEAVVRAPRRVGDNERVRLQVTALCAPAPHLKQVVLGSTPVNPCLGFSPCTPEVGPWVSTPSDGENEYQVSCPPGMNAIDSDAAFPDGIYPVGVITSGGLVPGRVSAMEFGALPVPVSITFQPGIGCSPPGAKLTFGQIAAAPPIGYRTVVRTVRVRPRVTERVRAQCRLGERLAHAGSAVAFFTQRPPSRGEVKALVHRHQRLRSGIEAIVVAPRGVGDNERVELQVSAVCARA